MPPPVTFRSRAPLRLDFAGGWTDVPPFATDEGGAVVNAAIQLYAAAEVTVGGRGIMLRSEDLGVSEFCAGAADLHATGPLALLKGALRMHPVHRCSLTTRSDAPPGSGLGSSGALDVALVSTLARARGEELDSLDLADQGWFLETREAGIAGGKQDQYAAALGGFHRLGFDEEGVSVERLRLDPAFVRELERRTVLCHTGTSRVSGDTIDRVMGAYRRQEPAVTGALRAMKGVADSMADALRQSDLPAVGALLSENWRLQRVLDAGMQTPFMRNLETAVASAGVWGGKAAGAGAGGCMFFIASGDPDRVAGAARTAGARVLPVAWSPEGVAAC